MYYFGPMDAFCRRRFQALLNRSDVNNRSPTTARSSPTRARSPRSSERNRARRGCSTASPPAAATRRAPAGETASSRGSCCPKARGSGSTGSRRLNPALAMSRVNSESRGALGFSTPACAFRAMLGEDAAALLHACGVEDVPIGGLDLTPGLIERVRAERGDAPLA